MNLSGPLGHDDDDNPFFRLKRRQRRPPRETSPMPATTRTGLSSDSILFEWLAQGGRVGRRCGANAFRKSVQNMIIELSRNSQCLMFICDLWFAFKVHFGFRWLDYNCLAELLFISFMVKFQIVLLFVLCEICCPADRDPIW